MTVETLRPSRFLGYKHRHCTDLLCLILFIGFVLVYGCVAIVALRQGNPTSLIQPSDSLGHICGREPFESQPYQLYFDVSKCLNTVGLSLNCPTTKLCVSSCPKKYSHYQTLQTKEKAGVLSKQAARKQLVCKYGFDPVVDNRTIAAIVNAGLCAPYTTASDPFLGRCLPSVLTQLFDSEKNFTSRRNASTQSTNETILGVNSLSDVARIMLFDLDQVKKSIVLFAVVGAVLALLYMLAVKLFTRFIVFLSILLFLLILLTCSAFCWYTLFTGEDFVYAHSNTARIVNDFIQLRTLYIVFGCITTFFFFFGLIMTCVLFQRIRLSIILLDEAASAVFSALSTFFLSPMIITSFLALTSAILYVHMCLSTVGKPIFRMMVNNQSVPCLPSNDSVDCLFQQEYGYDALVLQDTDPQTRLIIAYLVDYQQYLKWYNLFAFLWFGAFLFAFEEIVLAGVFSNYYWSNRRFNTACPLLYSVMITVRYHLGSIAFGSLLLAILRYIRIIFEHIQKQVNRFQENVVLGCLLKIFSCFLWIFEKFLKFLNKNAYVIIASRGYSFCKATRKAFTYIVANCLRFAVIVHLTEWILFCGMIIVCACNTFLYYQYLQWTEEIDGLILRWTPLIAILVITYLITGLFFSVYDMAIKTIFVCFLEDLEDNDGSTQRPYVMNQELLRLVHKTNAIEKK